MVAYIMLALGIICLTVFCVLRDKKSSAKAIAVKTVVSLLFIATAVAALLERDGGAGGVLLPALLMIVGLVLGLVGDVTLDFKIFLKGLGYEGCEKDSDTMTYFGMAAFGVGHVLYITSTALRYPGLEMNLLWSALVAVGLAGAIFGIAIPILKMRFGKYLIPSVSYAFLLCWFIAFAGWQMASGVTTGSVMLLVGSILFIVSDLILSMTYFSKPEDYLKPGPLNPESKLLIVANHVTYYFAQFLIALAIMFI